MTPPFSELQLDEFLEPDEEPTVQRQVIPDQQCHDLVVVRTGTDDHPRPISKQPDERSGVHPPSLPGYDSNRADRWGHAWVAVADLGAGGRSRAPAMDLGTGGGQGR